jgi:hypothetical protein
MLFNYTKAGNERKRKERKKERKEKEALGQNQSAESALSGTVP